MDLTALFSHSRTALLLCAEDRRITAVNAAASELLREAPERVAGRRVEDLVVGPERDVAARELASIGRPGGSPGWLPIALRTAGGRPFPAELTWRSQYLPGRHLVALRAAPAAAGPTDEPLLTERESEVLSRVARGETGPEIAEALFMSTATVERQVAAALRRLGARNRAHGIAIAVRTGQLDADLGASGAAEADDATSPAHRLALEALDGPAALLDGDGRAVVANVAWRTFDRGDRRFVVAPGENYLAVLDHAAPEDPDAAQAAWGIREVLEGHVVCFVLEYRLGPADDERWLEMRVSRYGGSPGTLLVRHRDITGQRDAALGSALLDEVDAAVAFVDLDGVVTTWRPSAERMFGLPADGAVGRPIWDVVLQPGEHDIGRTVLREVVRSGRWAGELALVRADGDPLSADVRLRMVDHGDTAPAKIVAAAVDVTDRVDALRRSMYAQEELKAVTDGMREGCVVLDAAGCICSANAAVTTLLGWQADQLVGRTIHEVLRSPLPGVRTTTGHEGADGSTHVDRFVSADGHEVPVEYTATRFMSADNSDRWALVFRPLPALGDPRVEGVGADDRGVEDPEADDRVSA